MFPQSAAEACWWVDINLLSYPYPPDDTDLCPPPAAEIHMGECLTQYQVQILPGRHLKGIFSSPYRLETSALKGLMRFLFVWV